MPTRWPNKQAYVEPTLNVYVGPTKWTTIIQHWPNVSMLSWFVQRNQSTLSPFPWETAILVFSSIPFILLVSKQLLLVANLAALFWTFSISCWRTTHWAGIPNTAAIFQNGANTSLMCCFFNILRTLIKISSQETKSSICLSTHVADMCIPSQVMCDCYS